MIEAYADRHHRSGRRIGRRLEVRQIAGQSFTTLDRITWTQSVDETAPADWEEQAERISESDLARTPTAAAFSFRPNVPLVPAAPRQDVPGAPRSTV
jgi:hypothetical protein